METPISSLVGGHALLSLGTLSSFVDFLGTLVDASLVDAPTRCNAAVSADLVSSHAGLSQSSPPPIDLKRDANLSFGLALLPPLLFELDTMVCCTSVALPC